MTSDLHWVDFKGGIESQIKQAVVKKDSYSSDSLDEYCEEHILPETEKGKISSEEHLELDMSDDKSLTQSTSDISSVHDNTSITSTYSFEILEETEALQTENITESVEIRISPRNSTVMNFDCSNNFYSEFSLVANVEINIPDANENLEDTKNATEPKYVEVQNCSDVADDEGQTEVLLDIQNVQSIDVNANESVIIGNKETSTVSIPKDIKAGHKPEDIAVEPLTPKKTEYFANKIEITKQEKRMSSSVEKKIAEEIKAMKEREEDLRAMREKLAKELSEKAAAIQTSNSEILVVPKPETIAAPAPNCDEKPVIKKATALKIENAYTAARVFAIKRKDVTLRNDDKEKNKSPSAITQQESPVEREIRIAKEREEELKRERQALKAKLEMDSIISEYSTNETDPDSALSICSDSSFDSVSKLAPLFPRTVSPEISTSNGISVYSSSAGSICSLESLSQRERQNNGYQSTGGSISGSVLSPSPDSAYCKSGYPFTYAKGSAEKKNKNIDMERFISSKGKEIKFKENNGGSGIFHRYYEIKPPQIKKGDEKSCKKFITAAAKIRNELKEMQEREEQFKKERATLHQDINNGEEKEISIQETNDLDNPIPSPIKITCPEIPEDLGNKKKQDNASNPTRRRSVLIDEWEQRIQKSTFQA